MWRRSLIRRSYPLPVGKPGPRSSPTCFFPVPRFTLRMAATLVDWSLLILGCCGLITAKVLLESKGLALGSPGSTLGELVAFSVLAALYFGGCYRFFGTTPGKSLFLLRLERAGSRARVGVGRAWAREVLLKIVPLTLASILSQHPAVREWLPGAYVLVPCLPVFQALLFGLFRTDGRLLPDLMLDTRVVGASRSRPTARWIGALTSRRALALQACLALALVFARYAERVRWMIAQPAALYEKFRPAIVRIEVSKLGTPVSEGTGFFISADGVLVTNDHVLGHALRPGMGASFTLSDGRKIDRFQIGGCSDERNLDLCIVRLAVHPKAWLRQKAGPVEVGEEALVIGHPLSYEFSLSQGIVSGLRKEKSLRQRNFRMGASPEDFSVVQFTAQISPGNSGGPVFNRYGELLGVATSTYVSPGAAGLNFGIDQKEVFQYLERVNGWGDPSAESGAILEEHHILEKRLMSQVFKPAFEALDTGTGLSPSDFRHLRLDQGIRKFGLWLPREMWETTSGSDGCQRSSRGEASVLTCPDPSSNAKIIVEIQPVPAGELNRLSTIMRPNAFLPYWTRLGIRLPAGGRKVEDLNAPKAEAFRCQKIRTPGGSGTMCSQVAYNVPNLESLARLVVYQRDEDGMLVTAFGVTETDSLKARPFEGALVAVRSFESEGYLDLGLREPASLRK